jgi:uncharacterized protein YbbK (DUF523 family)
MALIASVAMAEARSIEEEAGSSPSQRPTRLPAILVSACLVGMRTRWDGTPATESRILELADSCEVVPICPEVMGGLATPRRSSEIESGDGNSVLDGCARVISEDGADVTDAYLEGARRALAAAERHGAGVAYLKDRSPACGGREIKRKGRVMAGQGVCAAALARAGIRVVTV